jgi:hypothetical protein
VSVIRAAVSARRAGSGGAELKRSVVIRRIVSILALTLSVTALAAIGLNAEVFGGFQRRATDALFPAAPDDPNVAVVGFDTKTINTEGLGYPLPREDVARLIDNLKAAGARVIAFDVIYREEKDGDTAIRDAIDRAGNGRMRGTSPVGSSGLRCMRSLASTALSMGGSSRTWRHGATMMRISSTTEMTATMTSRAAVNSTAMVGCIRCIIARARSCSRHPRRGVPAARREAEAAN